MAKLKKSYQRWQGIADAPKESAAGQIPDQYYFGRAVDYRTDPNALTLLPGALKESGSVVTDLLKWGDIVPVTLTSYLYGNSGNVYSRSSTGSWTNLFAVPQSHGNGLGYFSGDDYVYVTGDSNISRYGPTQNNPQFTPNFLTAQGGVPQNTASILLTSASSMYLTGADSASLSVTGNITLETYFKANTLPTVGNSMTLIGKWDESSNSRSYKLDLFGVSGYFGAGTDSSLTISTNTIESPIDSACTGTMTTQNLSATNASFAVGQIILIHQTQGTNAGQWERNTVQGYTAGTITLGTPLLGTYTIGAQVRVLKQYTNVTINTGITYTAKAWDGMVGGIIGWLANGATTRTGNISATACGFQGGPGGLGGSTTATRPGISGEGYAGLGTRITTNNNDAGGGGGGNTTGGNGGGGGGGHATTDATNGLSGSDTGPGGTAGGMSSDNAGATAILFGAGGGGGASDDGTVVAPYRGGNGGGLIFITTVSLIGTGGINADGEIGYTSQSVGASMGGSGGGGGGYIFLKAQTATLGTNLLTVNGGIGSAGSAAFGSTGGNGGNGGVGRITLDYLTSYTGTTTPTLNPIQDNTLVTTTTIQARLGISNDGTAFEYLTQNLMNLIVGVWNRLSVTWTAASSLATFYLNAVSLGTATGTKTSINDNASLLYIGADKTSVVTHFFDGILNDTRIINNIQTAGQIFANNQVQLPVAYAGLQAYYKFNSVATDATGNANDLTPQNSPTYTSDVPFAAPTTRLDIDVNQNLTGNTYTLLTAISESSANKIAFTPVNDPQSSVGFYVDTKGTGNWTITVHDQQNRVVATSTIANANIPTAGFVEFFFNPTWRLLFNQSYHMHLTVSTGTSKVVTGTASNLSTAEYTTYFGFLVTDTQYHPVTQFQYQPLGGTLTGAEIIGNERYIAVWDGFNYLPNFITLPPGWHIKCFAQWRQYLAFAVWRGGNIYDFHQGRIYFWTGAQPAYDFFIDVPEGQINAIFGVDSDLYMFAGFRGNLLDYKGGYFYNTGNSASNKLKKMPLLESSAYTEVYPGALNMWRGLLHFGLYGSSNSTTSQRGVYSFGTLNQFYPDTLSYDYVISTGSKGSSVSIGLIYPVGQNLIIGWQDGSGFGADVVNFTNPPAASGEVQMRIEDEGNVWKDSLSLQARADFLPLRTGESIKVKFSIEREAFQVSTINSTVGDTSHLQIINPGRGREVQIGAELYATGTTSPTILGLAYLRDDLIKEDSFGGK